MKTRTVKALLDLARAVEFKRIALRNVPEAVRVVEKITALDHEITLALAAHDGDGR